MRKTLLSFFLIFLFFPYFILVSRINSWSSIDFDEYRQVFVRAASHSAMTALISLVFGYWGACGLISLKPKLREFYSILYLIPNFIPTLFVILCCLSILNPFPFGFWGIVLIQSVCNIGLVSVLILKLLEENMGSLIEHAMVDGASRLQIQSAILPLLKSEFFVLFILVFTLCFSGFAIPVMVGAGKPWTIEVLIFEKIKVWNNWSEALSLSFLQSVLIMGFVLLMPKPNLRKPEFNRNLSPLSSKLGLIIPVACTFLLTVGTIPNLIKGIDQFRLLPLIKQNILYQSLGTLFIGMMTGGFTFLLLSLVLFIFPKDKFRKLLLTYIAPSLVLTGFVFLLMGNSLSRDLSYVKISIGLALLMFPIIYKMKWFSQLQLLSGQNEMAEILGASPKLIFRFILFPQGFKSICFLSGLVAFWAAGDFAFSSIIAGEDLSVALLIQGLVTSYRLELACLIIWWMLLLGLLCYLCFIGINYVFSQKSIS